MAEALRGAVDRVVGMRGAIGDGAALDFWVAFYRALGKRCSVGNAVAQARATLARGSSPTSTCRRAGPATGSAPTTSCCRA